LNFSIKSTYRKLLWNTAVFRDERSGPEISIRKYVFKKGKTLQKITVHTGAPLEVPGYRGLSNSRNTFFLPRILNLVYRKPGK
jgi:hypothetical protein